ncbi:MAG TPA: hypothetical protein VK837_01555 [Longimicrobiales bacterium]|nr:hypothetical protein [Longimicrobiales bacterium]
MNGLVRLSLAELRSRLLLVGAVGLLFLGGAAATASIAGGGADPGLDELFRRGGYPLVSAVLLMGWSVGRFPIFAALVLGSVVGWGGGGGWARMAHARSRSPAAVYAVRWALCLTIAFAAAAIVLPLFDLLVLGTWAGAATFVLAGAAVLVYGALAAFLSAWLRADAALAIGALLAGGAHVWHSALRSGAADTVPRGVRSFLTFVLPPQGALYQLENAFAGVAPIPWASFGYAAGYAALFVAFLGISILLREI